MRDPQSPRSGRLVAAVALFIPALGLAQPALAQQQAQPPSQASPPSSESQQTQPPAEDRPPGQERAAIGVPGEALIGKEIYGADGESLGEIEDVIEKQGRLQAVLVDVGGFLGFGARRVAVPVDQISVEGDRVLAPELTMRDLEQLPAYQEGS